MTLCNVLWHFVTLCNVLWHYVTLCDTLWHFMTLCDSLKCFVWGHDDKFWNLLNPATLNHIFWSLGSCFYSKCLFLFFILIPVCCLKLNMSRHLQVQPRDVALGHQGILPELLGEVEQALLQGGGLDSPNFQIHTSNIMSQSEGSIFADWPLIASMNLSSITVTDYGKICVSKCHRASLSVTKRHKVSQSVTKYHKAS